MPHIFDHRYFEMRVFLRTKHFKTVYFGRCEADLISLREEYVDDILWVIYNLFNGYGIDMNNEKCGIGLTVGSGNEIHGFTLIMRMI